MSPCHGTQSFNNKMSLVANTAPRKHKSSLAAKVMVRMVTKASPENAEMKVTPCDSPSQGDHDHEKYVFKSRAATVIQKGARARAARKVCSSLCFAFEALYLTQSCQFVMIKRGLKQRHDDALDQLKPIYEAAHFSHN